MTSEEDMQAAVKYHSAKGDACYQSVYSFTKWRRGRPVPRSAIMNILYLDLDCEGYPDEARRDAIKLSRYDPDIFFSGKKGFAIYLHCEPADILPKYKKAVLRKVQRHIIEECNLKTADPHVVGDLSRVSRIPNTKHQDNDLHCIQIKDIRNSMSDIIKKAERPALTQRPKRRGYLKEMFVSAQEEVAKRHTEPEQVSTRTHNSGIEGEAQIAGKAQAAINTLKTTGHLTHKRRVGLVVNLSKLGWAQGAIEDVFRNASNYRVETTRYQVSNILSRTW